MAAKYKIYMAVILLSLFLAGPLPAFSQPRKRVQKQADIAGTAKPVLWRPPADVTSLDLLGGPGGKAHAPSSTTFTFEKEDLDGTNPKYVVKDAAGVKWKIKLGPEAKPETAATRLVWAAGYFANEDYYLPEVTVSGVPSDLHRGKRLFGPGGTLKSVRLKREDEKKVGDWAWKNSPFQGTREWNGLRVLMAVINNWDLKDGNNAVYAGKDSEGQPERIYMISDLGASFGKTSETSTGKGKLDLYRKSRFITHSGADRVNFASPGMMPIYSIFALPEYIMRAKIHWIAKDVPRKDARWMGDLLGRLTPAQVQDAFRAAGYSEAEVTGFTEIVERRIAQLREL